MAPRRASRASLIFNYALARGLDAEFDYARMCYDLEIEPGNGTRQAVRRAAELAAAQGLCLTSACVANGYQMRLTAYDADAAVDSMLHVGRTRLGVHGRERLLGEFVEAHAQAGDDAAILAVVSKHTREVEEATVRMNEQIYEQLICRRREDRKRTS